MLNPGLLDRMLTGAFNALNPGWSVLLNDVLWVFSIVATVYLVSLTSMVMLRGGIGHIPELGLGMGKVMATVWALTNMQNLAKMLIKVSAGAGLILSQTKMTAAEFALPGRVLWQGQDMLWPLINYVNQLSWLDYARNFFMIQFMSAAMWLSWIGFFVFALHMFYIQLTTFISFLLNFLKLAFGLLSGTADLANEGKRAILSQLFTLATVSLMVGLSTPWMQWLAFPENEKPGYWSAFAFVGGTWTIVVMALLGPRALQAHGMSLVTTALGMGYGLMRGVSWLRR